MPALTPNVVAADDAVDREAEAIFCVCHNDKMAWTDRMFAGLMVFQWLACVLASIWISPYTWIGLQSQVHPHVWAAVILGGTIAAFPVFLALRFPGRTATRYVIAVAQMLFSGLLIHLAGGRIETHFHVFGSLAFLSFYRDWRVLIIGSIVVALDHFVRGVWWPLSVFGQYGGEWWRWLEHAGWVVFLDIFLIAVALRGIRELRAVARRQAEMDAVQHSIEAIVIERTRELADAKADADSANLAKSEFLANMSHEIRTPLTAILGYCDILRDDDVLAASRQKRSEIVDTVRRAGEHLLTVINDILDLSKIEAGKLQTELIEMSLPRVLIEVDSLVRPRIRQKNVELRTTLESPIPDQVLSDPTRLRQILLNLVGNAAKFTEKGLIAMRTRVDRADGGCRLVVVVEDTGPGMNPMQAAMLFRPFTQADMSVTRKHGGTGLGLTISRRLAQMLGGDVRLDFTEPNKGSRFVLELPLNELADVAMVNDLSSCVANDVATVTAGSLIGKVLLAEDGEDNQQVISFHLRRAGARVEIAENGRVALEMLKDAEARREPFDILLSDMQMPEMDGYTLAKTLRASGCRIPIVALTAHAMAEDRQKCLEAGCNDYATKPINRASLIATCQQWIANAGTDVRSARSSTAATEILISELADDPDMTPLVDTFLSNLEPKVGIMAEHLAAQRIAELADLVHQLKGAGGSYGYPDISEAARGVEQCAQSNRDLDQLRRSVDELSGLCRRAIAGRPSVAKPLALSSQWETLP